MLEANAIKAVAVALDKQERNNTVVRAGGWCDNRLEEGD